jgi:hypothetical protein
MRFLFCTAARPGHFGPMVPIARACLDSGHEVAVAAPVSFSEAVTRAGLHHVAQPPGWLARFDCLHLGGECGEQGVYFHPGKILACAAVNSAAEGKMAADSTAHNVEPVGLGLGKHPRLRHQPPHRPARHDLSPLAAERISERRDYGQPMIILM